MGLVGLWWIKDGWKYLLACVRGSVRVMAFGNGIWLTCNGCKWLLVAVDQSWVMVGGAGTI